MKTTKTKTTLPAGTYWVGDLCYVLRDDSVWDEVCRHEWDGAVRTLRDGRQYAVCHTAYGDGCFPDGDGVCYAVDAGGIGCIALADIEDDAALGRVHEFTCPFTVEYRKGRIYIGHVVIDTN